MRIQQSTGGVEFTPIEEGQHDAVVNAIIELGTQPQKPNQYHPEGRDLLQVKILFEIPGLKRDNGDTQIIGYRDVTLSGSEKSNLFKLVSAIDSSVTKDNFVDYIQRDFKSLIGKAVTLTVKHIEIGGKKVHVVDGVVALDTRLVEHMEPSQRETIFFAFDDAKIEEFSKIGKFTREKILKAVDAALLPAEVRDYVAPESTKEDNASVPVTQTSGDVTGDRPAF